MGRIEVFPKIVVPQNWWFIMENRSKMDDLGIPLFSETSIYDITNRQTYIHTTPNQDWHFWRFWAFVSPSINLTPPPPKKKQASEWPGKKKAYTNTIYMGVSKNRGVSPKMDGL